MDLNEFGQKFQMNVPFTKYYCLVNAIPKPWKVRLTNPAPTTKLSASLNDSCFLKDVFNPRTVESKILRHGFTEKVYLMSFTVTKEVKIMFQYKVIHNVLTTRTTLYRDDLMEDATCNLCYATEKTLTHLLINCVTLAEICTSFQNVWYKKNKRNNKLSGSHILYGWFDGTKHWQVLNYCLYINCKI